jgi:PKD repeat protein
MRYGLLRNPLVATAVFGTIACAGWAIASGSNPDETIDTGSSDAAVAQALVGPGVAISNVVYTGPSHGRGTFTFTNPAVLGTAQGVVLSSGDARDVVGPNTSDSFSTDWTNPGDADLDVLAGYPTFDAAVLEFDFVPTASQVTFQYAFASDEYPEWVNTPYNDVFAFFINGTNCALVRQVAGDPLAPFVPVAVNNINASNPVQDPPPPPMRPDLFRANYFTDPGPSLLDLELDGITRIITCQAPVDAGAQNHMKLAIADASDGIYDSAVFIEAGSLVSNENPIADLGLDPSKGTAPLLVTATVEGEDPNGLPLTFTIDWGDGSSTAGQALPDLTATVTHTYVYGGEYIVTLTVSNGTLSGTDQEDVDVVGPPPPSTTTTSTPSTSSTVPTTTTSTTTTTTTTLPPCGAVAGALLKVAHVDPPGGDDDLAFKGSIMLAPPVAAVLDPVVHGVGIRLVDGGSVVLDVALPGGAYDPVAKVGWQVNKTGTRWTYVGPKVGGPGAITKVVLTDKSAKTPGVVTFAVTGKDGAYGLGTAAVASLVLPSTGACFEAGFPATPPAKPSCTVAKHTLTCR